MIIFDYMPDVILGLRDKRENNIDKVPCSRGTLDLMEPKDLMDSMMLLVLLFRPHSSKS